MSHVPPSTLTPLAPEAVRQSMAAGALLVDIRSADEHARERIPQAMLAAAPQLAPGRLPGEAGRTVIFHCRSGHRTRMNAQQLRACCSGEAYVLEGGLDAWKQAGLPVERDPSQPLELSRQVQIAAGLFILLGVGLGAAVSPRFYLVSGFVGAGLMFAGLSGFCGLARVLMWMPWNRRRLRQ